MARALADAWAKMLWADRHADALYCETSRTVERKTARIAHHIEPQTGDHVFWMKLSEEPPLREWGLIIGDVLHNLHSALDCVAWQLACIGLGREPTDREARGISFPIRKTAADFAAASLDHFTPTHRRMLGEVQPYQRGYDSLLTLRDLANRDKHRVIQPTYLMNEDFELTVSVVRDCEVVSVSRTPPGPFEDGRELARVQIVQTGPEPETEGHAKLSGFIALSDGTRLQHFIDQVGDVVRRIIREFEPTADGVVL